MKAVAAVAIAIRGPVRPCERRTGQPPWDGSFLGLRGVVTVWLSLLNHPVRDDEVTAAAANAGVTLYLTGARHFAH